MTLLHLVIGAHAAVVPAAPLEPDAETARRWAEIELSDPMYHRRPSLLELAIEWLMERLAEAERAAGALDPRTAAVVVGSLVLVGAVVSLIVAGPVRRARAARRASVDVFGDDSRTADELRRSADALAAQGRWQDAVLDRFRAILRSLEERTLLDERPGRTAHEASLEAGRRLPGCAEDLLSAGRLFDDVCYGDADADADADAWLRGLDERVSAARPAAAAEPVPAVPR